MKKLKNKITAIALSAITTVSTLFSPLPGIVSNAAYTGSKANQTTNELCSLFGTMYDEQSYLSNNVNTKSNNLSGNNFTTYQKQVYCKDIAEGYTFAMSKNFNKPGTQKLYRYGKVYDPGDTNLCDETYFLNNKQSDLTKATPALNERKSYAGDLTTKKQSSVYGGYIIQLQDSDKNNLSYLYPKCGTYDGKNIDVKLTVLNYSPLKDLCMNDTISTLLTAAEYNAMSSEQKSTCTKLENAITYNNNTYVYGVSRMKMSEASIKGVFNYLRKTRNRTTNEIPNRYFTEYGPLLRFRTDSIGVEVACVDWIQLKYEFFESGTTNPVAVSGYSAWKDIDGAQGVGFPQGQMDKVGAWTSGSRFMAHTFSLNGTVHNGYFDKTTHSTDNNFEDAWLYGCFSNKKSITTVYSFCGPMDTSASSSLTHGIISTDGKTKASNYSATGRLKRKYSSAGTIANDLPSIDIDRDLIINKYVNKNAATVEKYPELSKALRFYIIDSKGYYVNVAEENNSYKYTNSTENQTDNNLLSLNSSGKVFISDLPLDTYSIYEKIDDKYANDHPAIVGKYSMLNQTVNISDGVDWSDPNSVAAYQVDFNNTENPTKVNITKTISLSDGQTLNANSTNAKKLLENVQFAVKNSSGKYANILENGNVTWSETKSYFKMPNGTLKNINLQYGKYTLIEEAIDNKVNTIWDTDKSVDFIVNGTTGTVDNDGCLTCNIAIDNPELYGGISVKKTTETSEDIAGIEFILSGTSASGRKINMSMTTDKNGNSKLDKVPVGTYTLSENPDTVNTEKWQVAKDREVTVTAGQRAESNQETVNNSKVAPKVGHIKVHKIDNDNSTSLANADFTIFIDSNKNGTYEKDVDTFVERLTTDTNGIAERKNLPVTEEYLVKETKAPEGYVIDEKYYPVTLKANETFEVKTSNDGFSNEPIKGNIKLTKVDEDNHKQLLSNAHFVVYKDTNESGSYDEADVAIGSMTESSKGIYTFDNLRYGKYVLREIKAPDGYISDTKSYSVNITECKTYVVSNIKNTSLFGNKAKPVSITLTKRIPVNELNGDIWFPHGNPTFILRLKNTTQSSDDFGRTYYKAMEFTKEYVKEHLIEISGKKYVEMSVTFDNLKAGTYTADEAVAGQRYKLKDILNISDNATIKNNKCEFNLAPGQTGKATFFNVKKFWDTNTHNCLCVNIIKK